MGDRDRSHLREKHLRRQEQHSRERHDCGDGLSRLPVTFNQKGYSLQWGEATHSSVIAVVVKAIILQHNGTSSSFMPCKTSPCLVGTVSPRTALGPDLAKAEPVAD